jgi:hypothetical protein
MPLPPWVVQQALGYGPGLAHLVQFHGRQADLVAPGQAAVGLGPLAVDPDLAAADQLVNEAARGALELQQQEIVQALAVPVLGDGDHLHAGGGFICRHGFFTYTIGPRDNVLISLGLPAESQSPANPEEPLPHPTGVTMLAGTEGRRISPHTLQVCDDRKTLGGFRNPRPNKTKKALPRVRPKVQ